MARKKAAKKKATKPKPSEPKTTQFALRLETGLYEKMKEVAGEAEISINQLIQGICDAAMRHCHVGEAIVNGKNIMLEDTKGCVSFGKRWVSHLVFDGKKIKVDENTEPELFVEAEETLHEGQIWFGLDYSGRSYRNY